MRFSRPLPMIVATLIAVTATVSPRPAGATPDLPSLRSASGSRSCHGARHAVAPTPRTTRPVGDPRRP